jgi:hypothetical protein
MFVMLDRSRYIFNVQVLDVMLVAEFSLSFKVKMTLVGIFFWVYFSNSTTMPYPLGGWGYYIYRLLASQEYASC